MRYFRRILHIAVIAVSILTAAYFQDDGLSATPQDPSTAHGLVLILSKNQPDEPSDSVALKACLARHPLLACQLLTVTLKNEGKETILNWYNSCDSYIGFDVQAADGSWERFPAPVSIYELIMCSRNARLVRRFSPGQSYVQRLRLADLSLNTMFPPPDNDGVIHVRGQGYALLTGVDPLTVRARWHIDGCVASDKVKPDTEINPWSERSQCAGKTTFAPEFMVLKSNALNLR